jgi:NDP-sugar pyrophosphorylase family protein
MTQPTLVLLAAGMGSRYGGLKQVDPVGPSGETLLDYSIYDALRAGFGKVVFIIRHDIEEQFREVVGNRFQGRAPVEYAFQELNDLPSGFTVPEGRTKPWGTTQAIIAAEDVVQEPFAVLNADDFYGRESFEALVQHFNSSCQDLAMVGFQLKKTLSDHGTVARGICGVGPDGYLTSVEELTKIEKTATGAREGARTFTGDELVSMNFWGFQPSIFSDLRECFTAFLQRSGTELKSECYIPATVNELMAAGKARVKMLSSRSPWFGVTYKEDKPRVVECIARLVAQGVYPGRLWQ